MILGFITNTTWKRLKHKREIEGIPYVNLPKTNYLSSTVSLKIKISTKITRKGLLPSEDKKDIFYEIKALHHILQRHVFFGAFFVSIFAINLKF